MRRLERKRGEDMEPERRIARDTLIERIDDGARLAEAERKTEDDLWTGPGDDCLDDGVDVAVNVGAYFICPMFTRPPASKTPRPGT